MEKSKLANTKYEKNLNTFSVIILRFFSIEFKRYYFWPCEADNFPIYNYAPRVSLI